MFEVQRWPFFLWTLSLCLSALRVQAQSVAPVDDNQKALYDPRNQYQDAKESDELKPFGSFLFQGQFAKNSFTGFNPDYQINIGDQISVRLWGAIDFDQLLLVDRQGNVFLPGVGPIKVQGVKNSSLQSVVYKHVQKVFKKNVSVYASLSSNQEVKVYVTGFVKRPGLYAGLNSDSILHFIDQAAGVDPNRGSFLDIELIRSSIVTHQVDLYDFVLTGKMPSIQFHDGDTILIKARKPSVSIEGLVQNANRYELKSDSIRIQELLAYAGLKDSATHLRLLRNLGIEKKFFYYSLSELDDVMLHAGDEVEVLSDQTLENISIRIQGEHDGEKEIIVARGTHLESVLSKINFSALSQKSSIQLFRKSVRDIQKARLEQSLQMLERSILSASPVSRDEADLRAREADMILKLVERARTLDPKGQVVLGSSQEQRSQMLLESGDIIHIPTKSQVVMVHGEVLFPNAVAFDDSLSIKDYIKQAGGFTPRADEDHIVILHQNGSFSVQKSGWFTSSVDIVAGDEIFILPHVDTKTLQLTKDISQILYQLAVTTRVVLTL